MKKLAETFATAVGTIKIATFLGMIALFVPVTLAWKRLDPQHPFKIPLIFYRLVLRLLDIRLRVSGTPSRTFPTLFVANHASYLDVIVLGAVLPANFVAKSEVAGWPLFGFLARMQNTLFIERKRARAGDQQAQLQDHFAQQRNLILFPEGTSSDGLAALPFKSSLFSIAENSPVTVQPVSVTCTELDGFPLLREERPLYAWYGDMTLLPHLWNVFKYGHFTVDVVFHAPLTRDESADRKSMAAICHEKIAAGIQHSLVRH